MTLGAQLGWLLGAAAVGLVLHTIVFRVLLAASRREGERSLGEVARRIRRPASLLLPLLFVLWALGPAALPPRVDGIARHTLAVLLIAVSTWLSTRAAAALATQFLSHYDTAVRDNLEARRMHTRLRVITRVACVLIWGIGIAGILTTFPSVRQIGGTVLASAGIAGIVVGLAAQRTLGNFIAGLQIALTQPIRLDDAVVIDDEWGWIEEITATYVVVKLWDQRRLVVPFSRLLEEPFQNWTRTTSRLLGQVSIWADYTVPVQRVRDELHRIVKETALWDGITCVLQVVDATDRAIQLRALVSAADSPTAWDLRCYVREKLVEFLQREHPHALPAARALLSRRDAGGEGAPRRRAASTPEVGGLPDAPEPATR